MSLLVLSEFCCNRRGNFAMIFALTLPVMMFGIGLAIDFGHGCAGSHPAQRRGGRGGAGRPDARHDGAIQRDGAGRRAEHVQRRDRRHQFPGGRRHDHHRHRHQSQRQHPHPQRHGDLHRAKRPTFSPASSACPPWRWGARRRRARRSRPTSISICCSTIPRQCPYPPLRRASLSWRTSPRSSWQGCAFACHHTNTNSWVTVGNPCAKTSGSTTTYTTPTLNGYYANGGNSYCAAWQGTQIDNYQLAPTTTSRCDSTSSAAPSVVRAIR